MWKRRLAWWTAAALVGLLVGALVVVLSPAAVASAHTTLLRTQPSAGAVVAAAPTQVVLTFSEPVRLVPDRVRVVGPNGRRVDSGAGARGPSVRVAVAPRGATGTYVVSYRVVSADGHPIGGAFTFSVGAPSATAPAADDPGGTDPAVAVSLAAARAVGYVGLVLLVGPALALLLFWPRRLAHRGPVRLAVGGLALLFLGAAAELFLQAPYTTGTTVFGASLDSHREAIASRSGVAHETRMGVLVAIAVLLPPTLARRASGAGRIRAADQALLVFLAVVGLATWPLAGHAASATVPVLTVPAHMAHLAAVSSWLGGLVVLLGYLLRRADDDELDAVLPTWSRCATWLVGGLVLAGATLAVVQIGTLDGLVANPYVWLVLAKVALLALVLAAAVHARRLARGAGSVGPARRAPLRRTVLVELAVLVVVLGTTSALAQTPPAATTRAAESARGGGSYEVRLADALYSVQVYINPAQAGDNTVSLFAFTPRGAPLKVVEWKANATLPTQGIEPIGMALSPVFDSHAAGTIRLPAAGAWKFRFTLRTSEVDQATVTAVVPIDR